MLHCPNMVFEFWCIVVRVVWNCTYSVLLVPIKGSTMKRLAGKEWRHNWTGKWFLSLTFPFPVGITWKKQLPVVLRNTWQVCNACAGRLQSGCFVVAAEISAHCEPRGQWRTCEELTCVGALLPACVTHWMVQRCDTREHNSMQQRAHLDKTMGSQASQAVFITLFTTARHLSLSSARWIQSTPSQLV